MSKLIPQLLKRLRKDFQLSIITLMALFGILAISPYALYRYGEGNYLVSIADTVIVLATILAVLYAWRSGDTVKPGIFLSLIFSAGATLIAINLGVNGLFWIYPLILFNFFMVSPGKAMLAMLLVIGTLIGHALLVPGTVFESSYQMVSFLVTGLMASVLTYIFAFRTRSQRDQLQLLASQDPLTGARNRREMNKELRMAVSTHRRHGNSYGVLVMDLDHFKQINDRFGHPAGDQVLVDFVELIQQSSRQENRLFRFGGEEFLLLLPNTDEAGLRAAASHLQNQVRQRLRGPGGPVTMSVGGAVLRNGEPWEGWLQRADQHLYQAKNAGRDCSIIEAKAAAAHA
ncbi:GGDEF domain-containing protein [Pseudomonas lalucatii]|uniref:diguanylate cyclase n=1 Tax=Pseudomonas lalucatii TaxID=1424203 RepID=A0ABS5Q3T3_9PSED|nr:GGDEF domain-containing protein [Pseudomonas lalucatii]MBS7663193.1 GGDEF domain-containing protein [Pseudomonas lalucatii]